MISNEENIILDEANRKRVESLRLYKDHEGYKVICKIIQDRFSACVRAKLNHKYSGDQRDLDAEMRAWNEVGDIIDIQIDSYDQMIYQKLEYEKQQFRRQQGG